MKKTTLLMLFLSLCSLLSARENSEFEFFGFSEDRKNCAFEIYGTADSGEHYSIIYLIDVDRNVYLVPPFGMGDYKSLWDLRMDNLERAYPFLQEYGVKPDFKGTLVFYNPRIGGKVLTQDFLIQGNLYSLNLKERADGEGTMMTLTVDDGQRTLTLQEDSFLPESRKHGRNYSLVCAWYCYGKIAVIIEYEEPGFEGMNRRQMMVTVVLKTKNLMMQFD